MCIIYIYAHLLVVHGIRNGGPEVGWILKACLSEVKPLKIKTLIWKKTTRVWMAW